MRKQLFDMILFGFREQKKDPSQGAGYEEIWRKALTLADIENQIEYLPFLATSDPLVLLHLDTRQPAIALTAEETRLAETLNQHFETCFVDENKGFDNIASLQAELDNALQVRVKLASALDKLAMQLNASDDLALNSKSREAYQLIYHIYLEKHFRKVPRASIDFFLDTLFTLTSIHESQNAKKYADKKLDAGLLLLSGIIFLTFSVAIVGLSFGLGVAGLIAGILISVLLFLASLGACSQGFFKSRELSRTLPTHEDPILANDYPLEEIFSMKG